VGDRGEEDPEREDRGGGPAVHAHGGSRRPLRAGPRGTDIAFLNGIIHYAIEKKRFHEDYVKLHTNAPYVVGEKYQFTDGLFSGFERGQG